LLPITGLDVTNNYGMFNIDDCLKANDLMLCDIKKSENDNLRVVGVILIDDVK